MIRYRPDLLQGTNEWRQARCGLLTASEMKLIITPTLKAASNEKERAHLYELLGQRITQYVEPAYVSDAMLRGIDDENEAIAAYAKNYEAITPMGFVTNDKFGFTIGYSPDGLIGERGQLECKSRNQKYQIQTICDYVSMNTIDPDFMIQVQTGLLVTERAWCDLVSYCGGLYMATIRVLPDAKMQEAIIAAAGAFEKRLAEKMQKFTDVLATEPRIIPTVRKIREEMI